MRVIFWALPVRAQRPVALCRVVVSAELQASGGLREAARRARARCDAGCVSSDADWRPTAQESMRVWSQMIHVRPVAPEDAAVARYMLRTRARRWHLPALAAAITSSTWWLVHDLVAGGNIGRPGLWVSDGFNLLILVVCLWLGVRHIQLRRWAHRFAPAKTIREK